VNSEFVFVRQVLNHESQDSSFLRSGYCGDRVSLFAQDDQNHNPPILDYFL
jgi:hypothetical protein